MEHSQDTTDWKSLYESALLETDPNALLARIMIARNAIFDRIEENLTRPISSEHRALDDALTTLKRLTQMSPRKRAA